MATMFTSILNSFHYVKYNFTLAAGNHFKDIYDEQFDKRGNTYISPGQYAQPWQRSEPAFNQCITNGLSTIDITVYNSQGKSVFTSAMNVIANPAIQLPYVLHTYWLDMSNETIFPEDIYYAVLSSGEIKLRVSEYIDLRTDQPGTLLFKFKHSTNNKFNTYFTDLVPFRIDAALMDWYDDDTHENYTDEIADNELLDGMPVQKRMLQTRFVPDWVRRKLIYILMLNRCYIESTRYSRTTESKIDKNTVVGSNLASYKIEISGAINNYGLSTDETGSEDGLVVTYPADAQAFGSGNPGDIIDIEVGS